MAWLRKKRKIQDICYEKLKKQIKQIKEANEKLKNMQDEFEDYKKNTIFNKRKIPDENIGNAIYIVQTSESIFKIGKTANITNRTDTFRTRTPLAKVVHVRKTKNHHVLEKVIHCILEKYRFDHGRELFEVQLEIAVNALNIALIGYCYRIAFKNLANCFEEWKLQNDNNYQINPLNKKRLYEYISNKLLSSNVYNGKRLYMDSLE